MTDAPGCSSPTSPQGGTSSSDDAVAPRLRHRTRRRERTIALAFGTVCHTSFALGVGAMMVAMYYGMSRSLGRLGSPWGGLSNGLLLIQFPVVHSFLLSRPGRRCLSALAPRGLGIKLSTTVFATIASLQVGLLFALWTPSGVVWWRADGLALVILQVCYGASWLLLLKSIADAGLSLQVGLLGWWAVVRQRPVVYPPMPRKGLFRFCRQPIYLAFALTLWTVPTLTPDQLCVALVLTGYCVLGPLLKEARFRRVFGSEFSSYQKMVPYFLPRLSHRRAVRSGNEGGH